MRVFSNFHSTFTDGSSASAFELDRAYLGYDFNLSENFSGKINMDIGNSGNANWTSANHIIVNGEGYTKLQSDKNFKVFGRYDYLTSNTLSDETNNWNLSKDGNLIIAGVEFRPVKGVKISPNYRLWTPADGSKKPTNSFYISCDIKF